MSQTKTTGFLKFYVGVIFVIFALCGISAMGQEKVVYLWPNGAPGSEGKNTEEVVRINQYGEHIVSNVHHPSITLYLPTKDKATGAAVIVIPGGGHSELWMDHEGYRVAEWLSDHGVAAFVLKYRLAREKGSTYTVEGTELADVQRAIRTVRARSSEWGIDPARLGVMGFSAGGELATLASSRYDLGNVSSMDSTDRQSSKPSFQALFYPAIPPNMQVSKETPPAFLACGDNDREIAKGVTELYLAFKRAGVSTELHIYAKTGHGFGLRESNPPPLSGWPQLFLEWMATEGLLTNKF
jgi:endo-1,4-beta-xylanase